MTASASDDDFTSQVLLITLQPLGVNRVVIADGRSRGGDRVVVVSYPLPEQPEQSSDLSIPLGAIFGLTYETATSAQINADVDGVAIIISSAEGKATAVVAARMGDIADFLTQEITAEEFVRKWIVTDL